MVFIMFLNVFYAWHFSPPSCSGYQIRTYPRLQPVPKARIKIATTVNNFIIMAECNFCTYPRLQPVSEARIKIATIVDI